MQVKGDHAPDTQLLTLLEYDGWEDGVFSQELDYLAALVETFYREFLINDGQHNVIVRRRDGAIHDERVAIINADVNHRFTTDTKQERGVFVEQQVFVKIDLTLGVIGCRRRKARVDGGRKQGNG